MTDAELKRIEAWATPRVSPGDFIDYDYLKSSAENARRADVLALIAEIRELWADMDLCDLSHHHG